RNGQDTQTLQCTPGTKQYLETRLSLEVYFEGVTGKTVWQERFCTWDSSDNRKFVYAEICVFIGDL
ncbi:MAG: hypothetical protein DMG83_16995, partial [Acidobacteria bacterium]